MLVFYSGASLALARGKTERGGLGNLLRETSFKIKKTSKSNELDKLEVR